MTYHDEDFPTGLRCCECLHLFVEGEEISQLLTGFQDDIPMTVLVCGDCSLLERVV